MRGERETSPPRQMSYALKRSVAKALARAVLGGFSQPPATGEPCVSATKSPTSCSSSPGACSCALLPRPRPPLSCVYASCTARAAAAAAARSRPEPPRLAARKDAGKAPASPPSLKSSDSSQRPTIIAAPNATRRVAPAGPNARNALPPCGSFVLAGAILLEEILHTDVRKKLPSKIFRVERKERKKMTIKMMEEKNRKNLGAIRTCARSVPCDPRKLLVF